MDNQNIEVRDECNDTTIKYSAAKSIPLLVSALILTTCLWLWGLREGEREEPTMLKV